MASRVVRTPKGLQSDFEWEFATAAYQIEGGVHEDGRGPTIWDIVTHLEPSRTNGANGDVAFDHYHRYEEDLDLLVKHGAKAYRFLLAWSRIIPVGGRDDPVNEAGIDFYNKLIDGLLERGIVPWVTLYHWDLPQGLQDRYGGWLNVEESQKDFERYARVCYQRFGDRVKKWITLNEPWVVSIRGFSKGLDAPGRSSTNRDCAEGDSTTEPWIVGYSLILSHARAARLYNMEFKPSQCGCIGVSISGDYFMPWDPENPKDHEAAERRMDFWQGWFAHPMFLAQDYPDVMRQQLGDRLSSFTDDEFELLREAELDFYGMNYYTSQFARHRTSTALDTDYSGNVDNLPENKAGESIGELSGMYWLRSVPQGFRKHLMRICKKYGKPIYVTENGCPCPGEEKMTKEECVKDAFRQKYFKDHLGAIVEARQDGAKVSGYFAWSLMDNLEWTEGYGPRFGVTFTDYDTLERTPKESALKLRDLIEERIK
ncbi:beta-glucosidase 1B [Colletotrichum spaethianum]|uniref:beta-glucosidase n=1 Tax=Colletotrichum spaethianum TaxID=700344 RepID=A0AA37PGW0_9PEZI|nr:beta-glucosidase 1B [Colletotrichum spaethianum]GKT51994.1 beta-glucosidase 1B [Colletotrichum spaethianum]